jgi:hypothetical protein
MRNNFKETAAEVLKVCKLHNCVDVDLLAEELNESIYSMEVLLEEMLESKLLRESFTGELQISPKGSRLASR